MTRRILLSTLTLLAFLTSTALAEQRPWLLSNLGPDGGTPLLAEDGSAYQGELLVQLIADIAANGPNAPVADGPNIGQPSGDDQLIYQWVITTPEAGLHPAGAFSLYSTFDYSDGLANPSQYVRVYDGAAVQPASRMATSQLFTRPAFPASAQTVLDFGDGFTGYLANTAPQVNLPDAVAPLEAGDLVQVDVTAPDDEPVTFNVIYDLLPGGEASVQIIQTGPNSATVRWSTPVGGVGNFQLVVTAYDGHLYGSDAVNVQVSPGVARPSSFQPLAPVAGGTLWEGNRLAWQPSIHPIGMEITYNVIWSLNPDFSNADSMSGIAENWVDVFFTEPTVQQQSSGDGLGRIRAASTLSGESVGSARGDRSAPQLLEEEDGGGGPVIESEITVAIEDGETLYWLVRAVASNNTWRLSPASSAVAERPEAPSVVASLLSPADDATLTTTAPLFSWSAATDSDVGDTLTYDLRWSADGGANWDTVHAISGTEFDMSGEVFDLAGAVGLRDFLESAARDAAITMSAARGGNPSSVGGSGNQISSVRGRSGASDDGLSELPQLKQARSESREESSTVTSSVARSTPRQASGQTGRGTRLVAAEADALQPARSGFNRASAGRLGGTPAPITDDLPDNADLIWTVDAVDATGLRTPATETFGLSVDAPSSPTPFDLIFPADSLWVRQEGSVLLQWTPSYDADPAQLTYDVLATTDPDISDSTQFDVLASGLTEPLFELDSPDDQAWRWTVRAVENSDTTWMRGNVARLFVSRVDAPADFALLAPGDGSIIGDLSTSFAWEEAVDTDLGDSVTYTLSWTLDNWVTADSVTGLTETLHELTEPLPDDASVAWTVHAYDTNSDGTPSTSGEWSFTTFVNDPPTPFVLLLPVDAAPLTGEYAAFSWQPSGDPEEAGVVTYVLELSADEDFTEPEIHETGEDTTLIVHAWNYEPGEYWWRVTAADATGLETTSDVWSYIVTAAQVAGLDSGLPTEFGLTAAYPNPFNPAISVVLAVPRPGSVVRVSFHDILGRRVLTRELNGLSPGYHTVTVDLSGKASGPYFLQMSANGRSVETRRVTYLK